MSEQNLVRACLRELRARGCMVIRINSGAMSGEHKGKRRFVRFHDAPGCSDIIGMTLRGTFLAVEVKIGKNRPTDLQRAFLDDVNIRGGIGLVVVDDTSGMWDAIVQAETKGGA